ncbi:MAG: hypothetical protein K8R06_08745 [Methanosarcinales archaeon]|nr:hypothetical protein [Methanosarcinales archaeon]MCD4816472.1 hypothetical protein [Methanosarcinales archaeon]
MNRKEQIALAIAVLIPFAIVVYSFDVGMWGIILALPIFVLILLILLINPMKRRDLSIGTVVRGGASEERMASGESIGKHWGLGLKSVLSKKNHGIEKYP